MPSAAQRISHGYEPRPGDIPRVADIRLALESARAKIEVSHG